MTLRDIHGRPVDPLESPCVRNCCLDDEDICLGCGRTLDEIRSWSSLDEAARRKVLEQAEHRRARRPGLK